MIQKNIKIQIPTGLEARPVAVLVQIASKYESSIFIESGTKKVNAKSIMGMMALGLEADEEITVIAEGSDEEEAAALMGANGFTIFRKITFPHIKWAFLYGVVLCAARAMGEFGAVSVLSGHLRGRTNTLPLHVEILFNEFKYVPAFAVSAILVLMAVAILVIRSVVEYRGKKEL